MTHVTSARLGITAPCKRMAKGGRKDLNYVLRKLARRCASITLTSRLGSFSTSRCDLSRDILAS